MASPLPRVCLRLFPACSRQVPSSMRTLIGDAMQVSGQESIKGMTWAMLPSFGSAMAACTWHLFYNSQDLVFLVALQVSLPPRPKTGS